MTSYSTTHKSVGSGSQAYRSPCLTLSSSRSWKQTDIDPIEPIFCAWERVEIGGADVTELFSGDCDSLEDELVGQLEEMA
jgi:hypothetical protein